MRVISNNAFVKNIEPLLSKGNSVELCCLGSSMQPYLRGDGSEVIVASPFTPEELKRGTIVLCRYGDQYICHRIIRRTDDAILLQGDGVIGKREQITGSDVVGIIRTVIRRNRKPASTQSKAARCYWRCWLRLTPVRKYLLRIYRIIPSF